MRIRVIGLRMSIDRVQILRSAHGIKRRIRIQITIINGEGVNRQSGFRKESEIIIAIVM